MPNKKVYIVTSGGSTDYRINAVFSSKLKAKKYIEMHEESDFYIGDIGIEEYRLNSEIPKKVYRFYIRFDEDKNISSCHREVRVVDDKDPSRSRVWKAGAEWYASVHITVDDEYLAKKIATDRLLQFIEDKKIREEEEKEIQRKSMEKNERLYQEALDRAEIIRNDDKFLTRVIKKNE